MSTAQELALVPPKETALQLFQQPNGLEPYLQRIRSEIDSFVPNVTTRKGREEIASIAHRVARSKTALDSVGKELVAELKEIPKKIDAERKRVRDTLDAWRDEVRAPLNEWEAAEAARVAGHGDRIQMMCEFASECGEYDSAYLAQRIEQLDAMQIDASWEEFESEAHRVKGAAIAALRDALSKRQQYEAEQAELEELRRKQAEQEQRDREAEIARQAAEAAKREAEEKAQAERDAAARREAEAKAAAEQARINAELSERRRIAAEQQAELDRQAAIERERIAAEQAEQSRIKAAEQAAAAERQRIADEKAEVERQAKAREADKAHKAAINSAALEAFIAGGMPDDCAKQAVVLIAKGLIPNVRISY